jgi:hypothetical protein
MGSTQSIDSTIISELPEILHEFSGERIRNLWRGSRDGFDASTFGSNCGFQENTLVLIRDTHGNIFGGFTPLQWDSILLRFRGEKRAYESDLFQKSFVFTLKNPHGLPPRKFRLKPEERDRAILGRRNGSFGGSLIGPCFGSGDIAIADDWNANCDSHTFLGNSYRNDTGLDGDTSGSKKLKSSTLRIHAVE